MDTSQPRSKGLKGPDAPRCTETVPRDLCGSLSILPRCTLPMSPHGKPHHGAHRASYHLTNVGKVVYRWKAHG